MMHGQETIKLTVYLFWH